MQTERALGAAAGPLHQRAFEFQQRRGHAAIAAQPHRRKRRGGQRRLMFRRIRQQIGEARRQQGFGHRHRRTPQRGRFQIFGH